MSNIAERLSRHLVLLGVIPETRKAIVRYGFEIIGITVTGILFFVLVSICLGKPLAWVPFIIGFAPLRETAGGYHASKKQYCYIISTLMFAGSLLSAVYLPISAAFSFFCTLASSFVIWLLSPVESANKPLEERVRRKNRSISLWIILVELLLSLLFWCFDISGLYISMLFLGIWTSAGSLVAGKIKNKSKGEHYYEHN